MSHPPCDDGGNITNMNITKTTQNIPVFTMKTLSNLTAAELLGVIQVTKPKTEFIADAQHVDPKLVPYYFTQSRSGKITEFKVLRLDF